MVLGEKLEIMSECLKYQNPNEKCMEYAIISHNIDFVTFLMNEYIVAYSYIMLSFRLANKLCGC